MPIKSTTDLVYEGTVRQLQGSSVHCLLPLRFWHHGPQCLKKTLINFLHYDVCPSVSPHDEHRFRLYCYEFSFFVLGNYQSSNWICSHCSLIDIFWEDSVGISDSCGNAMRFGSKVCLRDWTNTRQNNCDPNLVKGHFNHLVEGQFNYMFWQQQHHNHILVENSNLGGAL